MPNYSAPGVYVEEISLLAPSIAEVESAVPAFVGYTETASKITSDDLLMVPTSISSFEDFKNYYGGPSTEDPANLTIDVDEIQSGGNTIEYKVSVDMTTGNLSKHNLYHCIKHFYINGGAKCYIVSVGDYSGNPTEAKLKEGLDLIRNVDEPTILAIPEAVALSEGEFNSVNSAMIMQAADLKDRFAIMNTYSATKRKDMAGSIKEHVESAFLGIPGDKDIRRYGSLYYPWLITSYNYNFDMTTHALGAHTVNGGVPTDDKSDVPIGTLETTKASMYNAILAKYKEFYIPLPPCAAIAGVYARVDRNRGFWKAPANVGLLDTISPVVSLSRAEHGELNVNVENGKSVNIITAPKGQAALVMGARTLDGNDNEWRYVNIRRFFSIIEESIQKSTAWVIFEPNTSSTWVKVQAMIENYLFQKWRDGALAGATPDEAFFVNVGLDSTMNSIDILEGRLIVEIGMAVARPAEFIILKFMHKMQTS